MVVALPRDPIELAAAEHLTPGQQAQPPIVQFPAVAGATPPEGEVDLHHGEKWRLLALSLSVRYLTEECSCFYEQVATGKEYPEQG
jgi:hypothetical protein